MCIFFPLTLGFFWIDECKQQIENVLIVSFFSTTMTRDGDTCYVLVVEE